MTTEKIQNKAITYYEYQTLARELDAGKTGYVYFFTNPEAETVKIGFASNVGRRLESIQTGNHVKLIKYYGFLTSPFAERVIHRVLSKHKIINEWYRHTDEVDELMECFSEHIDNFLEYYNVDDYPPLGPVEIDFVIDDWMNSYGRGLSAPLFMKEEI